MNNAWYKEHLTDGRSILPFSFAYDGRPSAALLAEWPVKLADEQLDANRTRRTLIWTDPQTALEVRCEAVEYADYPAIEWTVYFKNTGTANTPILENIQGLDAQFDAGANGEFVLHGIKGDFMSAESYEPYRLNLPSGSSTNFGRTGRSGPRAVRSIPLAVRSACRELASPVTVRMGGPTSTCRGPAGARSSRLAGLGSGPLPSRATQARG